MVGWPKDPLTTGRTDIQPNRGGDLADVLSMTAVEIGFVYASVDKGIRPASRGYCNPWLRP